MTDDAHAYLRARGGTAFPAKLSLPDGAEYQCSGLTARDWFAGQALIAIADDCGMSDSEIAERCYARADAMLEERSK